MIASDKRDLRNRMLSAQGHIHAITEMIDADAPCVDILHQAQAVRGAIRAINRRLLCAYLLDEHCNLRVPNRKIRARAWKKLRSMLVKENRRE